MNIKNTFSLNWSVEDPVYPYQSTYEYTIEEIKNLDMQAVQEQQQLEYADWLSMFKKMEQGQ